MFGYLARKGGFVRIKDYVVRIKKQWLLIAITTVAFVAGGVVYANIPEPPLQQIYAASSKVLFGDKALNEGNPSSSETLATATAIDLLATDFVRQSVAEATGVPAEELENVQLFADGNPSSNVLTFTAQSADPELALVVVNAAAESIVALEEDILNVPVEIIEQADSAIETVDVARDTTLSKILISFFLGVFAGIFLAFVRAWGSKKLFVADELLAIADSKVISLKYSMDSNGDAQFDSNDLVKTRSLIHAGVSEKASHAILFQSDLDYKDTIGSIAALSLTFGRAQHSVLLINLLGSQTEGSNVESLPLSIASLKKKIVSEGKYTSHLDVSGSFEDVNNFLASSQFGVFVAEIKNKYDFLFFMSPSLDVSPSSTIISRFADDIVILARTETSDLSTLQDTAYTLSSASNKPITFIAESKVDSKQLTS
jgi:capsular polysaccharide biosynthesis protein